MDIEYKNLFLIDGVLSDEEYHQQLDLLIEESKIRGNYGRLTHFVMNHTYGKCVFDNELAHSIEETLKNQSIIYENEQIDYDFNHKSTSDIIVSRKRSYEAAMADEYKGKKVAVLDFASSSHPGGNPWHANAQEEALCRTSTLFPCLFKDVPLYHSKHRNLDCWGTDDLIYLPNVIIFKSDSEAPKMLKERHKVDVIVSAAPHLFDTSQMIEEKEREVLTKRIEKIFKLAQLKGVEVLILGAFGCGAFHNDPYIVAEVFKDLLNKYYFEKVEFAIFCGRDNTNYRVFESILNSGK